MSAEVDRLTVRLPARDNALLELVMAKLKLDKGRAVSKNDVFLGLVDGFLAGRFQLDIFDGLDVAQVVRDADSASA